MAELVPSLVSLRAGFNEVDPARPTSSDGWIGDPAHAARKSDHNPDSRGLVHAIDITTFGLLEVLVQVIVGRCRSGAERRLKYVIFRRRIWSASAGWEQRVYDEGDPHTGHAHFSAVNVPALERDSRSWNLREALMDEASIAAALLKADVDTTAGSLSLGGAVKQTSDRTGFLANRFASDVTTRLGNLEASVADLASDIAAIKAAVVKE